MRRNNRPPPLPARPKSKVIELAKGKPNPTGQKPKLSEMHLTLHGKDDLDDLFSLIKGFDHDYPLDVLIKKASKSRTLAQNRTQHQWFRDAEAQGDMKAWEYRAYCKLHFGVPILRRDSSDYRAKYDEYLKHLPYEHKLGLMVEPFDFPVTSAMTVPQHSEFLDAVREHLSGLGFELTDPELWEV